MSYRYHSRRSTRRLARKGKRNFFVTFILIIILLYATITWILPSFIGGLSYLTDLINPPKKSKPITSDNASLAPPVFNIPYEATNSAMININGFANPNIKVKLYLDDQSQQTVTTSSDGNFVFEDVTLSLGTNNIYGKTIDDDNKESLSSKTFKIIYDDEKPTLSVGEPEDNKKIQGGDKKVKVIGNTEVGAKVYINDTQVIVDKDGNFNIDQPINEGDNILIIKAIDTAGNTTELQRKVSFTP